ncbi:MAG: hypothetical protein ACOC58_00025 [Chloroflexota bacterium]
MKLDRFLKKLEADYAEEKRREAEELHNAIAGVLAEHKTEIQTTLYVLELVKFELLRERYRQLFETAPGQPGQVAFRRGSPDGLEEDTPRG